MATKPKQQTQITLTLWDEFTTPLHRAGMAGLWMTLRHLAPRNGEVISWQLVPPDTITLIWDCSDKEAMSWLLQQAYQLENGLIKLPPLGDLTQLNQIALHQGITNTFIQHPRVIISQGVQSQMIEIEEGTPPISVQYKSLSYYPHQDLEKLKGLYNKQGEFHSLVRMAGWLYPGGGELHFALGGKTKLEEPPAGIIALAFAPIACSYYRVRSRLKQSKYLWALVVPDVQDMATFAATKQQRGFSLIGYDDYYASGLADTSLLYLTAIAGSRTSDTWQVPECEVWILGKEAWSKQSLITAKQRVSLSPEIHRQYALCHHHMPNGIKVGKNGTFIAISFGREIAAENILNGQPWYAGLHHILTLSTDYIDLLSQEGSKLHNLKEETITAGIIQPNATLFSDVFTWIIRCRYGQVSSSTKEGNKPNFRRVRTDLQMSIRSVRTREQFIRWWRYITTNSACKSNPFLQDLNQGEFHKWMLDNWEECLSLAAMTIFGYRDPWRVARTRDILLAKGLDMPKHLQPEVHEMEADESEESDVSYESEAESAGSGGNTDEDL